MNTTSNDPIMFQVSNLGASVHCTNNKKEWEVVIPSNLQNRPCRITVTKARIAIGGTGGNPADISKIWCESSISMEGASVQCQGTSYVPFQGYDELFDVDYLYAAASAWSSSSMLNPYTFMCPGLSDKLRFRAMCLKKDGQVPAGTGAAFTPLYLVEAATTQAPVIEFHLSIEFI